jgi:ubiquinone/menaquinone biosynthesis C-methylase UbiE
MRFLTRKRERPADNVAANLKLWDQEHKWKLDGDEWAGQAELCGVPYPVWKDSLVDNLIRPHVTPVAQVIEIAPGHGRWSEYIIPTSGFVTLVDLSPNCLQFCRKKFAHCDNVDYYLTTGSSLPKYCDQNIDFIWSYDSFVHMAPAIIHAYLRGFTRVLRAGGVAVIHHANIENLNSHVQDDHPGWRSAVNAEMIRDFATELGLAVSAQFIYWDKSKTLGVPRFGDMITILTR